MERQNTFSQQERADNIENDIDNLYDTLVFLSECFPLPVIYQLTTSLDRSINTVESSSGNQDKKIYSSGVSLIERALEIVAQEPVVICSQPKPIISEPSKKSEEDFSSDGTDSQKSLNQEKNHHEFGSYVSPTPLRFSAASPSGPNIQNRDEKISPSLVPSVSFPSLDSKEVSSPEIESMHASDADLEWHLVEPMAMSSFGKKFN